MLHASVARIRHRAWAALPPGAVSAALRWEPSLDYPFVPKPYIAWFAVHDLLAVTVTVKWRQVVAPVTHNWKVSPYRRVKTVNFLTYLGAASSTHSARNLLGCGGVYATKRCGGTHGK